MAISPSCPKFPALQASAWVHAAAAGGALLYPPAWPVAAGAVVANHLVLAGAGVWPCSQLLGPNRTELTGASRARGSFFVVGRRLEQNMALGREILRRGHTLENHSHTYRSDFPLLAPSGMRREIQGAQDAIAAGGGRGPLHPHSGGGAQSVLEGQLRRQGLELVSWTRRGLDTASRDVERVPARLARDLDTGDILLLHDGHAARTAAARPLVLEVLPRLLAAVRERGLSPVDLSTGLG